MYLNYKYYEINYFKCESNVLSIVKLLACKYYIIYSKNNICTSTVI